MTDSLFALLFRRSLSSANRHREDQLNSWLQAVQRFLPPPGNLL
jgi:hypothetical protein